MPINRFGLIDRTPKPNIDVGQTPGGEIIKIEEDVSPDSDNPVASAAIARHLARRLPLISLLTAAPNIPTDAAIAIYSDADQQHYRIPLAVFNPPVADNQPVEASSKPISSGYVFNLLRSGTFAPGMAGLQDRPGTWEDSTYILVHNGQDGYARLNLEGYARRNQPGGFVSLDAGGMIPPNLMPPIRTTRFEVATSKADAVRITQAGEFLVLQTAGAPDQMYLRLKVTSSSDAAAFDTDFDHVDFGAGVSQVVGQSGSVTAAQILEGLKGLGANNFIPFTKAHQDALAAIDMMHLGGTSSVGQITVGTDISFWVRPNVQTATWAIPLIIEHTGAPRVRLPNLPAAATPQTAKFVGIDPTTGQLGTLPTPAGGGIDWNSLAASTTPQDADLLLINTTSGMKKMTRQVFLSALLTASNNALKLGPTDPDNDPLIPMLFLGASNTAYRTQTMMYNPTDKTLYLLERGQGKAYQYAKDANSKYTLGYATDAEGGYILSVEKAPLRVSIDNDRLMMWRPFGDGSKPEIETLGWTRIDGLDIGMLATPPGFAGVKRAGSGFPAIAQDATGSTRINGASISVFTNNTVGLPTKPSTTSDTFKYRLVYVRDDGQLIQNNLVLTSSEKYKRDIHEAGIDGAAWVSKTRVVTFYYKDQEYPEGSNPHYGVIAEELHDVPALRSMVTYSSESRSRESVEGINNDALPFWNLAGLNYLYRRIEQLEAKLAQMEAN